MKPEEHLLEVSHLKKYFHMGSKGTLKAVDDVSFYVKKGETLGIVGESGCGKTTCARTCIGIYEKSDGQVLYKGQDVHKLKGKEKKAFTKAVQIIFQDPYSSLDPKMKVGDIIAEGLKAHGMCESKEQYRQQVEKLLADVGLNKEHGDRYVHEFSGGQRQRIGIARALAVEPDFIVCDEPISALDVSIQVQIINLLLRLQKERGLTYLFIAHDLAVVKHVSDRIAVMYLGNVVEITTSKQLYESPMHPYTQALLSAIPIPDPIVEAKRVRIKLTGELLSPINPGPGCRFKDRCEFKTEVCETETPILKEVGTDHMVACHHCKK